MRTVVALAGLTVATLTQTVQADSHHRIWWEYLAGRWDFVMTDMQGEVVWSGEVTYAKAPVGEALVGQWKGQDGATAYEVQGWQADNQRGLITGYGSNNNWHVELHQITPESQAGPMRGQQRDGTAFSGGVTIKKVDDDHWTWDFSGVRVRGDKHEMHGKLTRQRE